MQVMKKKPAMDEVQSKLFYLDTVGFYSLKINGEWPTEDELSYLPHYKWIKLRRIKYKFHEDALCSIQLNFTYGVTTPVFDTEIAETIPLKEKIVEIYDRIVEVHLYVTEDRIQGIKFFNAKGRAISSIQGSGDLKKSEHII